MTYSELGERVSALAATIDREDGGAASAVAILATRGQTAYAGVLATLVAGRTYVPLHTEFPLQRTRTMLALSGARVIVADHVGLDTLQTLLPEMEGEYVVIVPEPGALPAWTSELEGHDFVSSEDLEGPGPLEPLPPSEHAYILFTSGSTGVPKGVPVSHVNVCSYIDYVSDLYGVDEHDRVSQTYDLTFDLSVHDIFISLGRGACLHTVPPSVVMAPARFIRDEQLTMWFSVPSTVGRLLDLRMLKPDIFPSLRWSLFCGEPLLQEYAEAWQEAAPGSIVENLYGPTEATIAITRYRWHPGSPQECQNGIVPIGAPFPGQRVRVVDENGSDVGPDAEGELCLAGSQVTGGYLNAPEKNLTQFVKLPGEESTTWYRTGDLVNQDRDGTLYYKCRIDNQVKIRGYRVELQEIEHTLRQAAGGAMAVALPWPVQRGAAAGVVAFVRSRDGLDAQELIGRCRVDLPDYMVPRTIHFVDELPLNPNGKIDRGQLAKQLETL